MAWKKKPRLVGVAPQPAAAGTMACCMSANFGLSMRVVKLNLHDRLLDHPSLQPSAIAKCDPQQQSKVRDDGSGCKGGPANIRTLADLRSTYTVGQQLQLQAVPYFQVPTDLTFVQRQQHGLMNMVSVNS
ncbi:hypothetical protein HYFRA_00005732 [Hymenoscyphus fraxineus]|uniref:Uncharacterized protein n=1 Tax=Hymenoscyphus fraxineus TaxID=746836 RepID=A0A9N9KUU2_9HELO|nr:hypothetical protein HYFRA_00005732 [Hymenoscyphus fraxineus]